MQPSGRQKPTSPSVWADSSKGRGCGDGEEFSQYLPTAAPLNREQMLWSEGFIDSKHPFSGRYEDPDLDLQLSTELADSLRTLKVSRRPSASAFGLILDVSCTKQGSCPTPPSTLWLSQPVITLCFLLGLLLRLSGPCLPSSSFGVR